MIDIDFFRIAKALRKFKLPVFDLVVGIAEGGVVPASLLANKLKCDLEIIWINYRDKDNSVRYKNPVIFKKPKPIAGHKNILIVDDVSVSGKTLGVAARSLKGHKVKTMVFKGKADFVLFPEIDSCVNWPWKA